MDLLFGRFIAQLKREGNFALYIFRQKEVKVPGPTHRSVTSVVRICSCRSLPNSLGKGSFHFFNPSGKMYSGILYVKDVRAKRQICRPIKKFKGLLDL